MSRSKTTEYYFQAGPITCLVRIRNGIVQPGSAPIVRKFIGQPRENLHRWGMKIGHDCVVWRQL